VSSCCGACGLAAGLILMAVTAASGAAPTAQDVPPVGMPGGGAGISILDTDKPASPTEKERQPRGNPLWAIPLSKLTATRERPIFLPTRRPPAPVVANTRIDSPPPVVAPPPEANPRFTLVGAVSSENEAIAVFVDQSTNGVIRLRMGQNHDGWVLSSVKGREATLQKDQKTLVFNLPTSGTPPSVAGTGVASVPTAPANGKAPLGAAGSGMVTPDPSRGAPYIPRSTPKNGESDGL